jgi:hypothetical protein
MECLLSADLTLLVYAENSLEDYLQDNIPDERNAAKAKSELSTAESQLYRAAQDKDKVHKLVQFNAR